MSYFCEIQFIFIHWNVKIPYFIQSSSSFFEKNEKCLEFSDLARKTYLGYQILGDQKSIVVKDLKVTNLWELQNVEEVIGRSPSGV